MELRSIVKILKTRQILVKPIGTFNPHWMLLLAMLITLFVFAGCGGGGGGSDNGGKTPPSAPINQQEFNNLVIGQRAKSLLGFIDFVSDGKFRETVQERVGATVNERIYTGNYTYSNTGQTVSNRKQIQGVKSNTGSPIATITLDYDGGRVCKFQLNFSTDKKGKGSISCNIGRDPIVWELIEIDTVPYFSSNMVNQIYKRGSEIQTLTLPSATGGDGALSYHIEPDIDGLHFNPSTRELTGTPSRTGTYSMTYTVRDADDNSAKTDTDSQTFSITIQTTSNVPADSQAFLDHFVGNSLATPNSTIQFYGEGKFTEIFSVENSGGFPFNFSLNGSYVFSNTGDLTQIFESGLVCTTILNFDSSSSSKGTLSFTCDGGNTYGSDIWRIQSQSCLLMKDNTVPDLTLIAFGHSLCYSVYFDNPAENQSYSVISSNKDIAEVPILGGEVTLIPQSLGATTVTLSATDSNGVISMVDFEVTVEAAPIPNDSYDIDLIFISNVTEEQRNVFQQAAEKWQSIISEDIPDAVSVYLSDSHDHLFVGLVDDLRIYTEFDNIDGFGGTLAEAGPTNYRETPFLPTAGIMRFDTADFDSGSSAFLNTIVHEMAHVLGFGLIWDDLGLLENPSLDDDDNPIDPAPDTHFTGPLAIAAFNNAGGTSYSGAKVPVENSQGGPGTQDGHWRESVLDNELMTGFVDISTPLSAISIQSLADIGYTVDVSQADSYRLPTTGSGLRSKPRPRIHLKNDIRKGPITVIDADGRIVRVLR